MKKQKSWNERFDYIEELGAGGNAKVYHVKEKNSSREFALKQLVNNNNEKKTRFVNEICVARENASTIPGIIPIFDYDKEEYWYTMPIAIPIQNHIKDIEIMDIVSGIIQLTETLEELHNRGIYHRDIKPSNIYFYDNRFSFGDFGLVDFPDNKDNFTKSDRGLGAIFTIAPEMKRDPKHADGSKADVFSLAKTMWMMLSGDDRGFDGVYNFLDPSHSLRSIKKYKSIHLVELDELLRDATDNNPHLRPTIKEFKDRLNLWIDVCNDYNKTQASDWNFLTKQLFGLNSPESSTWRDVNKIVEVLNIVGNTPAYNHMLFSDGGGLDFDFAKSAPEEGCIYLYTTSNFCYIIKPKCLCYEGFDEKYRWNYFLLELDTLEPIFNKNSELCYEYLVEDTPAHYVSAEAAQYGVYNYDSGEPLPEGYKKVHRYIKGKFLIVMKNSPYNYIPGTYDGRHGLFSNSNFRDYIGYLIKFYTIFSDQIRKEEKFSSLSEDEIDRIILRCDEFNKNPFDDHKVFFSQKNNVKEKRVQTQKGRAFIQDNFNTWDFKPILKFENITAEQIKFCFAFNIRDNIVDVSDFFETPKYICRDGYIRDANSMSRDDLYYVYSRAEAINMVDLFHDYIDQILDKNGLLISNEYKNYVSIEVIKCGKPSHLFTKQEIKNEMRRADDRVNNQLVIDENGCAKVIKNEGYGYLYPVRHETWDAGKIYVGKYSNLLTLDNDYISSLQGWLAYLETGKTQYIDYVGKNKNEEDLINEIKKYY